MKTIFLALLFICLATPAFAENWHAIVDTDSGNRLLVDLDTLAPFEMQKHILIGGNFKFFDNESSLVSGIIEASSCEKGEGVVSFAPVSGSNSLSKQFYFSHGGSKIYDYVGDTLCEFWEELKKVKTSN